MILFDYFRKLRKEPTILHYYPCDYEPNFFERIFLKFSKFLCYLFYVFFVLWILYYFNEPHNQTSRILIGFAGLWLTFSCSKMLNIYKKTGIKALWIDFVLFYIVLMGAICNSLLVFIDTHFV